MQMNSVSRSCAIVCQLLSMCGTSFRAVFDSDHKPFSENLCLAKLDCVFHCPKWAFSGIGYFVLPRHD